MELDCQRLEVPPGAMRPVAYFLRSSSVKPGLGGKPDVYGRNGILVHNTEIHTESQTNYCDHLQGHLSAS